MINFLDLLPSIRSELILKKQNSLLSSIKRKPVHKPAAPFTPEGERMGFKEVTDVNLAEDGSIRTHIKDAPYPVRFYPSKDESEIIASFKRLFIILARNGFWGIIALWFNKKVWSEWLWVLFQKYQILFEDEHWSQPVRELRRVLKGKIDDNFLDAISAILEYDGAYRYRLQDIAGEIKKPFNYKEFKILLEIYLSRETDTRSGTYIIAKIVKKFIWIFRFVGLKQIKEIVKELNIDELKFSKEDSYHVEQYKINECGFYRFGGK